VVDIRLVHLPEELAGIRRQALDIATLAFGIDGVESEARLARTAEPRENDELVARELDVDVLQIVLTGTPDHDLLCHGARLPTEAHGC